MKQHGEGLVIKHYGGFYYVAVGEEILECRSRGRLKKDLVLSGDRVGVTDLGNGQGVVELVLPRACELVRPPIANVDTVIVVVAQNNPPPSLWLLDRLLVLIECQSLNPLIVINKSDLDPAPEAVNLMDIYRSSGYQVLRTSTRDGQGLDEVIAALQGQISVLAGQSGVGKSSLLNQICPGLTLKTGDVSRKIGRGRHTTRHTELFSVPGGGWIADSPGFSVLDLPEGITHETLVSCFPEIEAVSDQCRFKDCRHDREPVCAVKDAMSDGKIAVSRYEHFLQLANEIQERERRY
ncbi:MAG: ribosome small subunit-dependent GTPase A [Methylocystaceae bacterium]